MLDGVGIYIFVFFFQAEDGIRDYKVTGVQTCALGIYDFYRRPVTLAEESELAQEIDEMPQSSANSASLSSPTIDPAPVHDRNAALVAIREDIGDCTRCVLHKQGRKQIVFGVGNP